MHDYFDVLGVPDDASARDVRRLLARRIRRTHPDFQEGPASSPADGEVVRPASRPPNADLAVDFVDMSALTDRIQASFFDLDS